MTPSGQHPEVLHISCDDCVMVRSWFCRSCLVTFLCDREDDAPRSGDDPGDDGRSARWTSGPEPSSAGAYLALDAEEVAALGTLQRAGLAPVLRHSRLVPLLGPS